MILESREKGEPSNFEGSVKQSHLNLVDLAGSERAAQTSAEGLRLKEGYNINQKKAYLFWDTWSRNLAMDKLMVS